MGDAPERIVVGRIVKPHGIKGEVVVEVHSDSPERFARGSAVDAGDPDGSDLERLTVRKTRDDRGRLLVTFDEVSDRSGAERLHGTLLSIPAGDVAPLAEGEYYDWQLQGLPVEDEEGNVLGTLVRVDRGPASDLWIVDADGAEVMVPAVEEFVRDVDLGAGKIVISPIPGLFP